MVYTEQRGNSTSIGGLELTQAQYNKLVWLRQLEKHTGKQREEYIRLSTIQNFGYDPGKEEYETENE